MFTMFTKDSENDLESYLFPAFQTLKGQRPHSCAKVGHGKRAMASEFCF
jgi:hypothetical protein